MGTPCKALVNGECNEGARQDGARSFQFTVQAQSIKRGLLLWDSAPRCDTAGTTCSSTAPYKQADGSTVVARGYGGMMAAVGGRYVVGVGGRACPLCPQCLLTVHRCTRNYSLHPPPWPGHTFPFQLNCLPPWA